jgi:hypothetical protein
MASVTVSRDDVNRNELSGAGSLASRGPAKLACLAGRSSRAQSIIALGFHSALLVDQPRSMNSD